MHFDFKDINIRHLLVLAIGNTDIIHDTIDLIYNEKPNYYYKIYQESGFKNDMFFQLYPIKYLEYFEKTVGIVEDDYNKKTTIKIERLIKKGFPTIYKTVKNKSVIDDDDIAKAIFGVKIIDLNDDVLKEYSELELYNKYVILIYLGVIYNKKMKANLGGMIEGIVANYNNSISVLFNKHNKNIELKDLSDDDLKFYGKTSFSLNDFYDDIIQNELNELYYKNDIIKLSMIETFEEQQNKRLKLFQNGKTKSSLIGFYSGFLKGYGVHEYKLNHDIDVDNLKRYNEIINTLFEANNINEKFEKIDVVIPTLIMLVLLKELDFLSEHYKTNNEQLENFMILQKNIEIEDLKNNFDREIKLKDKKISTLEKQISEKEKREIEKDLEILNLNKKIEYLNGLIEDKDEDLKEVIKLREYIFDKESDVNENLVLENTKEEINNYKGKCVIIGGHPNWVKNIKEKINNENIDFIDFEKIKQIKNINYNQYTHLIINTSYFNHSVYNLLVSKLKNKSNLYYINNSVNVDYTIEKIKNILFN